MIIPYSPTLKVINTAQLSKGTGARYLMALAGPEGSYIAHSWKRTAPAKIPAGYVLIEFPKGRPYA